MLSRVRSLSLSEYRQNVSSLLLKIIKLFKPLNFKNIIKQMAHCRIKCEQKYVPNESTEYNSIPSDLLTCTIHQKRFTYVHGLLKIHLQFCLELMPLFYPKVNSSARSDPDDLWQTVVHIHLHFSTVDMPSHLYKKRTNTHIQPYKWTVIKTI